MAMHQFISMTAFFHFRTIPYILKSIVLVVLCARQSDVGQIIRETIQESFSYPGAVFGGVAYVFCFLLIVAGCLVAMMSSPVDGSISMGEKVGSMIMDVGTFGMHAILICFIVVPADRKSVV